MPWDINRDTIPGTSALCRSMVIMGPPDAFSRTEILLVRASRTPYAVHASAEWLDCGASMSTRVRTHNARQRSFTSRAQDAGQADPRNPRVSGYEIQWGTRPVGGIHTRSFPGPRGTVRLIRHFDALPHADRLPCVVATAGWWELGTGKLVRLGWFRRPAVRSGDGLAQAGPQRRVSTDKAWHRQVSAQSGG